MRFGLKTVCHFAVEDVLTDLQLSAVEKILINC